MSTISHQIEYLELPEELQADYKVSVNEGGSDSVIPGLSQINLFVGGNNSGKSRLLRHIVKRRSQRFLPYHFPKQIWGSLQSIKQILTEMQTQGATVGPFHAIANEISETNLISEGRYNLKEVIGFIKKFDEVNKDKSIFSIKYRESNNPLTKMDVYRKVMPELGSVIDRIRDVVRQNNNRYEFHRIYIPTLRGLRPLESSKTVDVYQKRTNRDYFENKDEKIPGNKFPENRTNPESHGEEKEFLTIFTGLNFYHEVKDLLLGNQIERDAIKSFENFLSKELFNGESVTLIPRRDLDVVCMRIGEETERPIYELGDGIQHLIILTFPLFQNRGKSNLVFIEEPELFLHPGMQRSLLKALSQFKENQYFISTHSNHLLDLTLEFNEISIYTLTKSAPSNHREGGGVYFQIEPASMHDHRVLQLLGSRVSSVFLSNCTIWVEGITDRRYIARFLELYVRELQDAAKEKDEDLPFVPKQDFHYSFVEYSGNNITHWSFLDSTDDPIEVERLCSKLMLIVDKDRSPAKDARHEKLEQNLGEHFYRLECREIENLLTPDVLRKVLMDYREDQNSIQEFEQDDYKDQSLGEFLESKLSSGMKRKGGYAAGSETIKGKINFCEKALKHMEQKEVKEQDGFKFTDLSPEAQRLTKRVYEFIKEQNR